MLEHAAVHGKQHSCISWQSHGRCFRVHNKKRFEQELMPLFFKTRHYDNFRKSLNNYGFKLIQGIHNPDKGCYYHPMFIRTQFSLCSSMKLVSSSREQDLGSRYTTLRNSPPSREKLMPFQEPNFHRRNHIPVASKQTNPQTGVNNDSSASLVSQQTSPSKDEKSVNRVNIPSTEIQEIYKLACVSPIDTTDEDGIKIDFDNCTLQLMKTLLPEDPRVLCNVFD